MGKHFDFWWKTYTTVGRWPQPQSQQQPHLNPYTWSMALSVVLKNSTKRGIIPVWITSSIGGFGSRDNNFLKEKKCKFSSIGSSLNDYFYTTIITISTKSHYLT